MATKDEKQYGLILPNKNKSSTSSLGIRKLNPLQDSDDELEKDEEDQESTMNWVEASLKKSAGNSGQQNLQKRMVREALEEDASVFQYDEIYDEMQANKSAQVAAKKQTEEKKPKYIHNILKQAEKRKLEGERRTERKVQKEREDEGDMFADKESFVTPSYLKKMEELKQAEAEAKLEEMREESIDVMKHKNFGAFYNHLFKQKMGESEVKKEKTSDDDDENKLSIKKKKEDPKRQKHYRTQRDLSESPERESRGKTKQIKQEYNSSGSDEEREIQSYRDRRDKHRSDDDKGKSRHKDDRSRSDDKEKDRRDRKHGRDKSQERDRNSKHRRSRSRDRHRRSSRSVSPHSSRRDRARDSRSRSPQRSSKNTDKTKIKEEPRSPDRKDKDRKEDKQDKDDEIARKSNVKVKKESELEEKEKRMERIRKLFTKRTVGEKFDQSLQRFYMRKAEREAKG